MKVVLIQNASFTAKLFAKTGVAAFRAFGFSYCTLYALQTKSLYMACSMPMENWIARS